jgi:hypothetical protein
MEDIESSPKYITYPVFVAATVAIIVVLANKWVFNFALKQKFIYGIKVENIHKQTFILNHQ